MNIVAGPIVRRVSIREVDIWLATTDAPEPLVAEVREAKPDGKMLGTANADVVQAGRHLFIHLVRVKPEAGTFPAGVVLAYDLRMADVRLSLSAKADGLTYGDHATPTFVIQPNGSPLVLLASSCRKLHGPSTPSGSPEYDGLEIADEILGERFGDPSSRPHLLMLMGDQIYADDVALELNFVLEALGTRLIGDHLEKIPGLPAGAVGGAQVKTSKTFVDATGFTTDEGGCHLVRFSDFAAMYCVAWKDDTAYAAGLFPKKGPVADHLRASLGAVRRVRRVLANTPTAMIFDDHEITDDWNLDQGWKDRVMKRPAGRRIIANGLAAYALFQAWGNDPDQIPLDFLRAISSRFKMGPDKDGNLQDDSAFENATFNFAKWSYDTATSPPVVVPDSRTARGRTSARTDGGVALIQSEAVSGLGRRLAAGGRGRPGVLVLATPPFMPLLFEAGQHASPISKDDEGFAGNETAWAQLLDMFLATGAKPLVIMAGDVHFGFVTRVELQRTGPTGETSITVVQLTASALRNATDGFGEYVLRQLFPVPIQRLPDGSLRPSYSNSLTIGKNTYSWRAYLAHAVTTAANIALVALSGSAASSTLYVRTGSGRREAAALKI